jgi:hypothetical protein
VRTVVSAVALAGTVVLATGPGAAASATGPGASASAAAGTWTVSPGGAITVMAGKTTLTDTPTGAVSSCQSSRMSGTLKQGSGLSGTGIGSLTTAVYSLCQAGPFPGKLTARGLPWRLNLTSYDRSTGVARGTISHLQINFAPSFIQCTAAVKATSSTTPDGVAPVSYASRTGTLKILTTGGDLHFYHVRNCAGIVRDGDAATLSASYTISPRQVITSP